MQLTHRALPEFLGYHPRALALSPAVATASGKSLQNVNSGYCVAIDQTHNPQGAPGLQVGRDGRHDRKFLPVPMGGNQYTLQLVQNSLCLDSPNESTKSGAQVGLGQVHLARFTTLVLRPQWDGTVGIFNGNDGLCLDIAYEREDAYAPVVQGSCTGHTSQRWRLV
jgi:hypothetical protein